MGGSLCLIALAAYRGQLGKVAQMPRRPLLVAAMGALVLLLSAMILIGGLSLRWILVSAGQVGL